MERQATSNPLRRFFGSRLFLLVVIPLLFLVVFGYIRAVYSGYKINQEIAELESEIRSLEKRKIESMEILQYVMSDDFVEAKARTELHMKKPGENMVVITNPTLEEAERPASDDDGPSNARLRNPIKWWYYFAHKSPPGDA